jgi:hypothetical protein
MKPENHSFKQKPKAVNSHTQIYYGCQLPAKKDVGY